MRLLVDISAHGNGHLAQTAPVLSELRAMVPDIDVVIRSGLPRERLARRIDEPFETIESDDGFGLVMADPVTVDPQTSVRRYGELHADLDGRIEAIAGEIRRNEIDAVLANVGYLPLAAAKRAGVPALAFSSINWRDVLSDYAPDAGEFLTDMARCYGEADLFLQLLPGVSVPEFATATLNAPVAGRGKTRRDDLSIRLNAAKGARIVLFASAEGEAAPQIDLPGDVLAIGPDSWPERPGWFGIEKTGLPFLDLVASADLVVAKPGYGIVCESVLAQTPLLLCGRNDWPETAAFIAWMNDHDGGSHAAKRVPEISAGELATALDERPSVREPVDGGARRAASIILRHLQIANALEQGEA